MDHVGRWLVWTVMASVVAANTAQAASISFTYCSHGGTARSLTFANGVPITDSMPRAEGPVETFEYIVPPSQFTSGALIVKASHFGIPRSIPSVADTQIEASRPAYETRCRERLSREDLQEKRAGQFYSDYDRSIEKQRYINYHFYKDVDQPPAVDGPNAALDRFHAELGVRHISFFFLWSGNVCDTTDDDPMLGRFLFDDTLTIANLGNHAGRYVTALPLSAARAHASAREYADSYGQAAAVIPYEKPAGRSVCIKIKVPTPAARISVEKTTISVVDADDVVLNPALTTSGQTLRTITWQP